MQAPCGSGLLTMAVDQLPPMRLTYRDREQARSHRFQHQTVILGRSSKLKRISNLGNTQR